MPTLDNNEIRKILPHRYPFLLVDKVLDYDDTRIVGLKNVTVNEPQFMGHFPEIPVMPGVLITEAMAQVAGVLVLMTIPDRESKLVLLASIEEAKFRKPVVPGDTIEFHVTKIARKKNMWWFRGEAKVAGEMVAEAQVGAMVP